MNITFNIQRFSFVLLLCFEFVSFVWLNKYQWLTLNRSPVNIFVRLMTFINLIFCWHCVWQICRSEVIYLFISVLTFKKLFYIVCTTTFHWIKYVHGIPDLFYSTVSFLCYFNSFKFDILIFVSHVNMHMVSWIYFVRKFTTIILKYLF